MLQFFRRNQRFFFLIVTIVVVISFSFFGTYGAMERSEPIQETVIVRADGVELRRREIEEMVTFLNTDQELFFNSGGQMNANYLNDGVISNDFLATGMAEILVEKFKDELAPSWREQFAREQQAGFYTHPGASFISAEAMWGYFAPGIKQGLRSLKTGQFEGPRHFFDLQKQLYLAEQQFPSLALKQVIRYQERQYRWVTPDPYLDQLNLALFGYQTAEEWFGTPFVHLVSQFVINAAKIAEQKGYTVTDAEALADLTLRVEATYKKLSQQINLADAGVGPNELFNEELRRLGMDKQRAVALWRQVLLFRRLFDTVGTAMFLDPQMFAQFDNYALETVSGDLYQLPPEFHLTTLDSLLHLQLYLEAIGRVDGKKPLEFPQKLFSAAEVKKNHPELVQKRYLLEISEVHAKALQSQVGIKAMWDWQVAAENWPNLVKQFKQLGATSPKTEEERFAALEKLPLDIRVKVDEASRQAIVAQNPEWLEKALDDAKPQRQTVAILAKGGSLPFLGVDDPQELLELLDSAPLNQPSPQLQRYSGDGLSFYRIQVIDRSKDWELLTFAEAVESGSLQKMAVARLEPFYEKLKEVNPKPYKEEKGSWRPLSEVRDLVVQEYLQPILLEIKKSANLASEEVTPAQLAAQRFFGYLQSLRDLFAKESPQAAAYLKPAQEGASKEQLAPVANLSDQWKLVKSSSSISRNEELAGEDLHQLFALKEGFWSGLFTSQKGDLRFIKVDVTKSPQNQVVVAQQLSKTQLVLANEIKERLMERTLDQVLHSKGISLHYLNRAATKPESASQDNHETAR